MAIANRAYVYMPHSHNIHMHGDAFNAESAELMQEGDISLPTSIGTDDMASVRLPSVWLARSAGWSVRPGLSGPRSLTVWPAVITTKKRRLPGGSAALWK